MQDPTSLLNRRAVVRELLRERGEILLVSGLGAAAWDVTAAGDHSLNFPLWGAMGGAAMLGLGLALAQPSRKVLVITGDGEMLMGMGSLATIAVQRPNNLRIVVLDNERYGETGQQLTHTASGTDLAAVARACGFPHVRTINAENEIEGLRSDIQRMDDLFLAVVKVALTDDPLGLPPRDGAYLKNRMRGAILGADSILR
jgi:thiamine pyrophosphate-dependent acetolactate synthase large subunit-like protein